MSVSTHHSGEPIAVVGLGCRFAGGADSPAGYWDLLLEGRDGIGEMPQDRWAAYRDRGPEFEAALRRATAVGGWLGDISGFDAAFFGLTPREAELMDPQQRLLLEVAWEALEHAGIPARLLAGSDTGVFVGVGSDDYGRRLLEDLPGIEAWTGIGSAMCAVANRISYALDLHGPSLAVDTACSASLAAAHLACQSLRAGESSIALVGGVNLMISPGLVLTLDAAGATAPDGRSKPFGADADGYGRGEGAGVLVLKRLSDARRDGDRVLAVIRGSSVRQDGRTNGIMAPNGDAQRDLLADACRRAGVEPASVSYVEAHGTGTRLGDPLEAGALQAVYGRARPPGDPLLIGSAKSNIGHLEAGAGVAALIKATLALTHELIPPSLHFGGGNPAIDWAAANLRVVTEPTPWRRAADGPRRAGVSGFGYGGTIGHIVLEEAPPAVPATAAEPADEAVFPISAAGPEALRVLAGRLADRVEGSAATLADIGHTLAHRRSHLEHRAAVVAADRATLGSGLRALAAGEPGPRIRTGVAPTAPGAGPVWVFSGHGSHWAGMGRELLLDEPVFAAALAGLEPVFLEEIGFSPRRALLDGDFTTVDRIQTLIFATQIGLAAMWRAAGATPAAVIGHSVGEIAAAVTAGALSVADGARLICRRSILLRRVAGAGAMAMVALPFDDVERRLAGRTDVVAAIAASPSSTVVSGDPAAIAALVTAWEAEDVQIRRVDSDVAFHSPQMDALVGDLAAAAATLPTRRPTVRLYTTALADPRAEAALDGSYWAANLRNPVRLAAAVAAAAEDGHRAFIEVSAHPVVAHSIRETLTEHGIRDAFVGSSLRRDRPQKVTLLAAVADAYGHGVAVDWSRLQPAGTLTELPTYPWQREHHWRETSPAAAEGGRGHDVDLHTLLGSATEVAGSAVRLWRTTLTEDNRPYPGSHRINGAEIVPAAVLITTFLAAGGTDSSMRDLSLRLPVVVDGRREVQVVRDGPAVRLAVRDGRGGWLVHADAEVRPDDGTPPAAVPAAPDGLRAGDPADVQRLLTSVGVPTMGFAWQVTELHRATDVLSARVATGPATTWAPLLDAALSIAPSVFPGAPTLRMVAGAAEIRLAPRAPETATVRVELDTAAGTCDVWVIDGGGAAAGRIIGLRYATMGQGEAARPAHELVHEIAWQPVTLDPDGRPRPLLVTGARDAAVGLRDALVTAGADAVVVPVADLGRTPADHDVLVVAPRTGRPTETAGSAAWELTRAAQLLAGREGVRLWAVTTGVRECHDEAALGQSPVWGAGRVLAQEHDDIWGGVVDLPPGVIPARELLRALRAAPGEDVLAVRDGRVLAARLRRGERKPAHEPLTCRPDGTYLITGGLGALGLLVARRLAERGARRLVLAARRTFPPRSAWDTVTDPATRQAVREIRALEGRGVTVRTVALDVAAADQVARLLDPEALGLTAVRGVVHAAGVLDNRMAAAVDEESIRAVLHPKAAGAWALHEAFPPGTLDFFVLFSSCGYLLGMPGQTAYGAANAFLDGLAAHRPDVLSLGWTSWQGRGMAVNDVVDRELAARGVGTITAAEAFDAWDRASRQGPGHYPVLPVTGGATRETLPLLREVAAPPTAVREAAQEDPLAGPASPEELRERLLGVVGDQIATEMRLPATTLDVRRSLIEQGLDSVMTIVIRKRLEKRFGHKLPATLLWHQPTVTAIADHLAGLLEAATDHRDSADIAAL